MRPHQSIAVGVRVLAIWLLLEGLSTGYFALVEFGRSASTGTLILGALLTAVWVLAGVVFWSFPQAIAHKLLPHESGDGVAESGGSSPDTWFAVGCSLIGMWLIVSSLPPLAQDIADTWPQVHLAGSGVYFTVRLALGACLLLGVRGLRKIFRWTQHTDSW